MNKLIILTKILLKNTSTLKVTKNDKLNKVLLLLLSLSLLPIALTVSEVPKTVYNYLLPINQTGVVIS